MTLTFFLTGTLTFAIIIIEERPKGLKKKEGKTMTKAERIQLMRSFGEESFERLYSTDAMQAILNYSENYAARMAGVYNMRNVVFSDCLDLCTITFQTKKAKNDFCSLLFNFL